MNKWMLSLKTSLAIFMLSLALTSSHTAQAEDIEVYGSGGGDGTPVNVLFIFDLSGSMESYPNGTVSAPVGQRRYDVLLEALTKVLDKNKSKTNLRVGISWFNEYASGIMWPVSGIADDVNSIDPEIPASTFQTYSFLPHLLETSGYLYGQTAMVDALLEAAYYFQGEEVWNYHGEPQIWDVGDNDYHDGNDHAPSIHSYTATDTSYPPWHGTHAYTRKYVLKEKIQRAGNTTDPRYVNGYNPGGSVEEYKYIDVRNCNAQSGTSYNWVCPVADTCTGSGETLSCSCPVALVEDYYNYTYNYCDYDEWDTEWLGAKYNSPIENSCTPSYIILLSDGAPTINGAISDAEDMIGKSCATIPSSPDGKCGPEIVKYLATNDQVATIPDSKVFTHTIGFNVAGAGKTYLKKLARKGKGEFYPASSVADLEAVFDEIIGSITGSNESFVGMATSVKPSTLSSDSRVFMNMFQPGGSRSWTGNTKGYFIDETGLLDVTGAAALETADGLTQFKSSTRSFWSASADGNDVGSGGASGKLSASRTIYTYVDPAAPSNESLTQIKITESAITPALLGVADNTEKDALITWLYDSKMADPIHPKPVLISYAAQDVLFSMTNQGLVHAIDTTHPTGFNDSNGGDELFAFIPQALLPQLKDQMANANSTGHLYGLDGAMSHYHEDTNKNHVVDNGEKVYLYFGMRRGGNHYYALDVSNPSSPTLAWRIDGGAGNFAELGQTWSRMIPTTVKWSGGVEKKVLIFGGGYDTDQDDHTVRTPDDIGNAVFMVDAVTGGFLWKATQGSPSAQMQYSIPGDITVIDSDDDRIADRLYFGDMGGQVWRFDLDQAGNGASISGYRLANLGGGGPSQNRRFYSAPSVAKIQGGTSFYYAVAIGSGFRAHPLIKTVDDYFYMIKDTHVDVGPPATTSTFGTGDLYDITANVIGQGASAGARNAAAAVLESKDGWKLALEHTGEKNLTTALIFDSKLIFTTFTPADGAVVSTCGGGGGAGRLYLMNLENGTPVMDFEDDTTPESDLVAENRYKSVPGAGIPTEPVPYFPPGVGKVNIFVGKNNEGSIDNPMARINWKVIE